MSNQRDPRDNKPREGQKIYKGHVSVSGLKWLLENRKISNGFIQIGFTTRVYPHQNNKEHDNGTFEKYDYLTVSGYQRKTTIDSINMILNDEHPQINDEIPDLASVFRENEEKYGSFVALWEHNQYSQKKWKLHVSRLSQQAWNFIDTYFKVNKNGIIEYDKNCFIILNKESNFMTEGKEIEKKNIPDASIVGDDASVVNSVYVSFGKIASSKNTNQLNVPKKIKKPMQTMAASSSEKKENIKRDDGEIKRDDSDELENKETLV